METITIDPQFNGPENSGNGGYVCGLIADRLPGEGARTSSLRIPPPLGVPLSWSLTQDSVSLRYNDVVVGSSTAGEFAEEPLACPRLEQAEAGLAAYPGFGNHPFNHCFTCGTAREPGDGLRIFTGPISESTVAGPWSPHPAFGGPDGSIDVPTMWAALDCPGGWAADFTRQPMVLGRMTAEVFDLPVVGQDYLCVGGLQRAEGRKFFTNTALYSVEDNKLLGRAEQIWIAIDLKNFS